MKRNCQGAGLLFLLRAAQAWGQPIGDLHSPVAHMDITVKAYQVYAAQYSGGELSRYIGGVDGDSPAPHEESTVVAGSFDEDKPFRNPWNQMLSMANHFWECREGYYKGWEGNDSAVNRAHKYWSGGYGIEGQFDSGWEKKGDKDDGVLGLYRKGHKAKAYWYLGHVAHLLEDLTVPAHALLFTHVGEGTDAYETYTKHHFREWKPGPQAPVESFGTLLELFRQTTDVANDFDAGSGPGDKGRDGKKDRGTRRAGRFSEAQLKEEAGVLLPLAYRRVAALFVLFFKQIDQTPPQVTLLEPLSDSAELILTAQAADAESGVDRSGYRFEYRTPGKDSGWTAVTQQPSGPAARFIGRPGRRYEFRVTAVDAAGNAAVSPPRPWTSGFPALARL